MTNAINNKKLDMQIVKEVFWAVIFIEMLSQVASSLSSLINGLIIGNALDSAALAALGLCAPVTQVLVALAMFVASGSKIVCGYYIGRGEREKVHAAFTTAIIMACAIGAVMMIIILAATKPIAVLFGATDDTLMYTMQYLRAYSIAFIPVIMSPTLAAFLMMCNKTGKALIGSLIQGAANLLLGLAAVKLVSGGMFEIGIASAIGVWSSCIFMAVSLLSSRGFVRFDIKSFSFKYVGKIAIKGVTGLLMTLGSSVRGLLLNKQLVIYGGTNAVAAMSVLNSILMIQDAALMGGANVISMHYSVAVGEKDPDQMKRVFGYEAGMNILIMGIIGLILSVFGQDVARIFGADDTIARLAQIAIIEYHLGEMFFAVMYMSIPAYQCLGYTRMSTIMSISSTLIFPIIFIFLLAPIFGVAGIWGAFIGEGVLSMLMNLFFVIKNKKHFPKNLNDWLLLNDKYSADRFMNITVDNVEDVCKVSQSVGEFLKENGIDDRRCLMSGLCMEEMAANIVEHGFTKTEKKNRTIDIYAAVDGNDVIMRLRDNAPEFDPFKRLAMHSVDENDPAKNVGIRMVSKIAKEMDYKCTFGRNVLLIKL